MKSILNKLIQHQTLTNEEAKEAIVLMASGEVNNAQMAAFMSMLLMRPINVSELKGFRDALLELCVSLDFSEYNAIDLCGTGGDGKDTFNISTLSAVVVASTGQNVIKHGNYGVSSTSGSSNVLEYLGYKFTNDEASLRRQAEQANLCFLHAPLFHPSMKSVASIRKELGVRTFFNMLGPLVNPANVTHQLTGVYNLEIARIYHYLLESEAKSYSVIHDLSGYDECSLTGIARTFSSSNGVQDLKANEMTDLVITSEDLYGGSDVPQAGEIFMNILKGKGTEIQTEVVASNAALALQVVNPDSSFRSNKEKCKELILAGIPEETFNKLLKIN